MLRTLKGLRRKAQESTAWHGHRMRWVLYPEGGETSSAPFGMGTCRDCGAEVQLLIHPDANQIDIAGPAVATTCMRTA